VVRIPGYRSRAPGSVRDTTRYSWKMWIWNGVHSASWVQLRSYLKEIVETRVYKTENTAVGIRCAKHVAPSIHKSWHWNILPFIKFPHLAVNLYDAWNWQRAIKLAKTNGKPGGDNVDITLGGTGSQAAHCILWSVFTMTLLWHHCMFQRLQGILRLKIYTVAI
jgi:hypothetical protein